MSQPTTPAHPRSASDPDHDPLERPGPVPLSRARRLALVGSIVALLVSVAASIWLGFVIDNRSDVVVGQVQELAVDPGDGTLYATTYDGLFVIPADRPATRVADSRQETTGLLAIGPRHFLGSGHPDPRESKPALLGLIDSTDAGRTWTDLSLSGEADFHVLEAKHGSIYAYAASSSRFMVTADQVHWDRRAKLTLIDFVVSPADPNLVLATTEDGLVRSQDGGRAFAQRAGPAGLRFVSWPSANGLFGITDSGAVLRSSDSGRTWQPAGNVDGGPQAFIVTEPGLIYAATRSGIYLSRDNGQTFSLRYRD